MEINQGYYGKIIRVFMKLTRIARLRGWWSWISLWWELVAIVTNTDLELNLILFLTYHVPLEEGRKQVVLVSTQVFLRDKGC